MFSPHCRRSCHSGRSTLAEGKGEGDSFWFSDTILPIRTGWSNRKGKTGSCHSTREQGTTYRTE